MSSTTKTVRQPFIEHIRELRTRIMYSIAAVLTGSGVGWILHEQILDIIQKPLNQTLYYTSPAGGVTFIFKLCFYFGLLVALPIVTYQLTKFFAPVIPKHPKRVFLGVLTFSTLLAISGVLFGYYISLPAALHFFTTFGGDNIQSIITADEYFNFVSSYLLAFALLFQVPLIVLFINRFTPLSPSKMMKMQRYVVLGSFIFAAILTPTPDPINQLIMAAPVIVLYQVAVLIVMLINARRKLPASAQNTRRTFVHPKQDLLSGPLKPARQQLHPVMPSMTAPQQTILRKPNRLVSDFRSQVPRSYNQYRKETTKTKPTVHKSMDMIRTEPRLRLQAEM